MMRAIRAQMLTSWPTIIAHPGLAAASVTDLIDRLERKQFAQSVRDAKDRRRVIVTLNRADRCIWTFVRCTWARPG